MPRKQAVFPSDHEGTDRVFHEIVIRPQAANLKINDQPRPLVQRIAEIIAAPIDDTKSEDIETVVLTLVKAPSYLIGAQSSATVSINDND